MSNFLGSIFNGIKSGITSVAGFISDVLNPITHNQDNFKLQKENLDYQKDLQNKIFQREDTAVQRQVNDLINAGLSPTLASGGGSSAGSVVSTSAPSRSSDVGGISSLMGLLNFLNLKEDLKNKSLSNVLLQSNIDKQKNLLPGQVQHQNLINDYQNKLNDLTDIKKIEQILRNSKLSKQDQMFYLDKFFTYLNSGLGAGIKIGALVGG